MQEQGRTSIILGRVLADDEKPGPPPLSSARFLQVFVSEAFFKTLPLRCLTLSALSGVPLTRAFAVF